MFKIEYLKLYGFNEEEYTYCFSEGINFIKGGNGTGKTQFYEFIDFIFGKNIPEIAESEWYKGTLKKGEIKFSFNGLSYQICRELAWSKKNYFKYAKDNEYQELDLEDYKEKLNSVFFPDRKIARTLHEVTGERLSYRSFTLFSFFGEDRQGRLYDFFDKCDDLKYSIKLPVILDFLFNESVFEILKTKNNIEKIRTEISRMEDMKRQNSFYIEKINSLFGVLKIFLNFDGKNTSTVNAEIENMRLLTLSEKKKDPPAVITELEATYNSLSDQIKAIEAARFDVKQFEKESLNRKKLLEKLDSLIKSHSEYEYLINPIKTNIKALEQNISFCKYAVQDETLKKWKARREQVKKQLQQAQTRFVCYSVEEKTKALLLLEEYLKQYNKSFDEDSLKSLQEEARRLSISLKELQERDNINLINKVSTDITNLYLSAADTSVLVSKNKERKGFSIAYVKRGNTLQPQHIEDAQLVDYHTGSLARHTLIRLCGYLAFLKLLVEKKDLPFIPILVIDHISKNFDAANNKAIGAILNNFYSIVKKEAIQIIMFDDKSASDLNVKSDHYEDLVKPGKSGFNPFYYKENLPN